MWYLLKDFWIVVALALVLGVVVGVYTAKEDERGWWRGLIPWGIALVIGGLISVFRLLPNGVGYWFDLAMLLFTAYLVGCLASIFWKALRAGDQPASAPAMASAAAGAAASASGMAAAPRAADVAVEPAKMAAMTADAAAPEEAITGLSGPRGGKGDDLTKIYGIDEETQRKLNGLGIYHYDQLATLTPGQRRWLFRNLGYEGRFPSWWWRWRYDAEMLGKAPAPAASSAPAAAPVAAKSATSTEPAKSAASAEPAKSAASAEPAKSEAAPDGSMHEGEKPAVLAAPRGGKADDLKRIRGIGKQNEGRLHALGVWHFDQIAAWTADQAKWVGGYLAFPGRIEREEWISQAAVLAKGGDTAFSKRVDKGEVATSRDESNDDGQKNVATLKDGKFT